MAAKAHQAEPRTYEVTYLLAGTLTDQEVEQAKTDVAPLFARAKAEVLKADDWGRRQLAYVIPHDGKKQTDAYYVHQLMQMPASSSQALDRELALHPRVMRHLVLVVDSTKETPNAT